MGEVGPLAQRWVGLKPAVDPVAQRFKDEGYRLYLVGGIVRDLQLGRLSGFDIDFTTDAEPGTIKALVAPLADAIWSQGERFGTIGASVNGQDLEITTHRAERYDPESRKPVVSFGDQLHEDLSRRDFTINAMAIELPGGELHDPHGGATDLEARVLRTPLAPEVSFNDDPLRMLRAARFISRFDLNVDPAVTRAASALADRLGIVSVERVADEMERLLAVDDPTGGMGFLQATDLLSIAVAPMSAEDQTLACALAAADLVPGVAVGPSDRADLQLLVRRAGLLWPTDVASVLARLRYSNANRQLTEGLVSSVREWIEKGHATLGQGRRLVARVNGPDAALAFASNLVIHHRDPTVVASARRLIDVLTELVAIGETGPFPAPLSGAAIMAALGVEPGPVVGRAQKILLSHRFDHGPFDADEAIALLRSWYDGGRRA